MPSLLDLVARSRVVVCAGPGGVGKTTVAASLAVLGAQQGRRTLVATVDPAPRLVDALALPDLGPTPRNVPAAVAGGLGIPAADSLAAVRIDTAHAFESLVRERIADPEVCARILANKIYQQITGNLTATQEYAANLALCELQSRPDHELLVLDTPPSSSAIDFFEAPERLAAAIESPLVNWLLDDHRAGKKAGRFFSLRRLGATGAVVVKRMARLVGSDFLADLSSFLADFEPVLSGFIEKTTAVARLLRSADVAVLLITAPEAPAIEEAIALARRLNALGLPVRGAVINRVLPAPGRLDSHALAGRVAALPGSDTLGVPRDVIARSLSEAAHGLHLVREMQRHQEDRLRNAFPDMPIVSIPLHDVGAEPLESLRRTAGAVRADHTRSAA